MLFDKQKKRLKLKFKKKAIENLSLNLSRKLKQKNACYIESTLILHIITIHVHSDFFSSGNSRSILLIFLPAAATMKKRRLICNLKQYFASYLVIFNTNYLSLTSF
jgi:hypothetical protein